MSSKRVDISRDDYLFIFFKSLILQNVVCAVFESCKQSLISRKLSREMSYISGAFVVDFFKSNCIRSILHRAVAVVRFLLVTNFVDFKSSLYCCYPYTRQVGNPFVGHGFEWYWQINTDISIFLDIKQNFCLHSIVFTIFSLNRCTGVIHVHLCNNHNWSDIAKIANMSKNHNI